MLESLTSALFVVLALVGLIAILYYFLAKLALSGTSKKYLLLFPREFSDTDDIEECYTSAFAYSSVLRSNPFFAPRGLKIIVIEPSSEVHEILENIVTKNQ